MATANNFCFIGRVFLKGRDSFLSTGLLGNADDGVKDQDSKNLQLVSRGIVKGKERRRLENIPQQDQQRQ